MNEPSVLVQGALFIQGEGVWLHSLTSTVNNCFHVSSFLRDCHQHCYNLTSFSLKDLLPSGSEQNEVLRGRSIPKEYFVIGELGSLSN